MPNGIRKTSQLSIGDERITYQALNQSVNRMAHHLLELGVRKGDRVGYLFYNSNQFVEIFFAAQKIGAIGVPVNFRSVPREVKWVMDNSGCRVLAYSEKCSDIVGPVKSDFLTVEHLIYSGESAPAGEHHFEAMTGNGIIHEPDVDVIGEDRSLILYTGGTTGFPKGVVYSHRSCQWLNLIAMIRCHVSGPEEVKLVQLPLFHQNGLNTMIQGIAAGGKNIFVESFDSELMLRLIQEERVTYLFFMPPSMYIRILDVPGFKNYDTSSVLTLGGAAGVLPKSLMLRILDGFPSARFLYGYGCTEAGGGILGWITREMIEKDAKESQSVGKEMPFFHWRLVDDDDNDVPVGEVGEAILQSPSMMIEYFNQPELTAETMRNGWVHTGDLLRKDEDGYYYFVDRKKDMIKSGGENVFAQEVEGVILSHPAVEMCAVIGVPDPVFIEAVMAVIKLRAGQTATGKEIIEHCKQSLASYKKPRHVAFVDSFPLGAGIKIQKFKLREQYSKINE